MRRSVEWTLAIVKPDEPFLVKLCNFGKDQFIVRKNSTLGFAEPYQGPMLSAVWDDESPKDGTDTSSADISREPLADLDLSEAPEYLHKQIRDMLKTNSSMWDGTLTFIRATEHAIFTPPGALPIRAQPYRTGPFEWQIISDQINKMLKLNVMARSHSALASHVVIVPKKNGKDRFYLDYRRLNNITKKDAYPSPRIMDFLDSLGDAQLCYVSRLHRGVLASALTQGRPRADGVQNALWYIQLVINAFWLDERTCNLPACIGYYPLALKVADMPRLLRRCHRLLRERGTTRQGR